MTSIQEFEESSVLVRVRPTVGLVQGKEKRKVAGHKLKRKTNESVIVMRRDRPN